MKKRTVVSWLSRLVLLWGAAAGAARAAPVPAVVLWRASIFADVGCPYGSPDCNACAWDVEAQFADAANGRATERKYRTAVSYDSHYPPANDTLFSFPVAELKSHFQGVAHVPWKGIPSAVGAEPETGSGRWYVITMGGEKDPSGFGAIYATHSGAGQLRYYWRTPGGPADNHPGGLAAVGKYVLVPLDRMDSRTGIDIFDLSRPQAMNWRDGLGFVRIPIGQLGYTRTASVAAARLANGEYIILSHRSTSCDESAAECEYSVFRGPSLESSQGWVHMSTRTGLTFASEGLALIPECATGRLYGISSDAPQTGGPNRWKLFEMKLFYDGTTLWPELRGTGSSFPAYSTDNCQTRGAGLVHADAYGNLVFLCHEKAPDDNVWDMGEWTVFDLGLIVQQ